MAAAVQQPGFNPDAQGPCLELGPGIWWIPGFGGLLLEVAKQIYFEQLFGGAFGVELGGRASGSGKTYEG